MLETQSSHDCKYSLQDFSKWGLTENIRIKLQVAVKTANSLNHSCLLRCHAVVETTRNSANNVQYFKFSNSLQDT